MIFRKTLSLIGPEPGEALSIGEAKEEEEQDLFN